jgi:hypothetical protein
MERITNVVDFQQMIESGSLRLSMQPLQPGTYKVNPVLESGQPMLFSHSYDNSNDQPANGFINCELVNTGSNVRTIRKIKLSEQMWNFWSTQPEKVLTIKAEAATYQETAYTKLTVQDSFVVAQRSEQPAQPVQPVQPAAV